MLLPLVTLSMPAWSFEAFQVSDIRVEGLQRISPGTVFNFLPVEVGDRFAEYESELTIRALFKSGYFRNVSLEREGTVLVVLVTERPAIADIKIQGNEDLETEPLLDSLKDIGFAKGRVFDRALLEKVELELERQYYSRGKYGVKVVNTPMANFQSVAEHFVVIAIAGLHIGQQYLDFSTVVTNGLFAVPGRHHGTVENRCEKQRERVAGFAPGCEDQEQ